LWLSFSATLDDTVRMEMSSLLPLTMSTSIAPAAGVGADIYYYTDMLLQQRHPISASNRRTVYSSSPLPSAPSSASEVAPAAVLAAIHARNETLVPAHTQPVVWTPNSSGTVRARVRVSVPVQSVWYVPSIAETLKVAWVQYVAILVALAWLMVIVKSFVFRYQLVSAHVASDARPPQKAHLF
jgi:hypothetical protein